MISVSGGAKSEGSGTYVAVSLSGSRFTTENTV